MSSSPAAASIARDPNPASFSEPEWAITAPYHGMTGRYQDSNVKAVWQGASHTERQTWLCIRRHESMDYHQPNREGSGATGAGQWTNGTWDGLKKWVKVQGRYVAKQYDRAMDAPAWVQDAAYRHVWRQRDLGMWAGTHCAPALGAW